MRYTRYTAGNNALIDTSQQVYKSGEPQIRVISLEGNNRNNRKKNYSHKRSSVSKLGFIFVLCMLLSLSYVNTYNQFYKIQRLQKQLEVAKQQSQQLLVETTKLKDLDYIQKIASSELHMKRLTNDQIISL